MTPLGSALPDLSVRRRRAEIMDDPDLDRDRHLQALEGLARINRISLAGARMWREVANLGPTCPGGVRVLDLACGGGDVLMDVAGRARRAGAVVTLHGCDVSPVAVRRARVSRGAEVSGSEAPGAEGADRMPSDGSRVSVEFFQRDVLEDGIPGGYHLVTSSLFLHHLSRMDVIGLLRRAAAAAERAVLMQDLRRTRLGYLMAWIGVRTLTRSDVARVDGPRSVEGAFTLREMEGICAEAGLEGAEVVSCWPQRLTVRWGRGVQA